MKSISLIVFSLGLVLFSACQYEEGPSFSLISKKSRAVNTWIIDQVFESGVDKTDDYKRAYVDYKVIIGKDDSYTLSYRPFNLTNYQENGAWKFSDDKSKIIFTPKGTSQQNEWKILRLKNSECWVIQRVDGKDIELRMKD
jgi:hypothetical protein